MRTQQEIEAMRKAIRTEIDRVPIEDVFGDSNEESVSEMEQWLKELELKSPPKNLDIKLWLEGKWSPLCDVLPDKKS